MAQDRQDWIRRTIPFVMGVLFVILPLAAHNLVVGGEIATFKAYASTNLAAGNSDQAAGGTPTLPGGTGEARSSADAAVAMANQQTGKKLSAVEVGSFWLKQGVGYILSHPLSWIGLELRKAAYIFTGYEISKDRQVYFFARRSPALSVLLWELLIAFPVGLLLPLALPAVATTAPLRRNRKQCLPIGYVVAYVIIMLLFTVTSRYRAMVLPVVVIWSAAGFWTLVQLYKEASFSRFYRWIGIVVIGVLVCNGLAFIPGLSPRVNADFEGYVFTGNAYMNAGKYAEAERDLLKAAALNPNAAAVLTSLGDLCVRQNKDSVAVEYYKYAIAAAPDDERPKKAAAAIYHKRNRFKDLADLVVKEIKKNPKAGWALNEYAYVHVVLKEYALAADLYERAFEADSTDYNALFLKAGCYLAEDMRMEAAEEYKRFLRYVPNSVEARANLAQVYARQMKYDLALQEFQAVSQAQPDNPAGYFNLASIHIQMGNLDEAEKMLNKTAQLDPNFQGLDQVRDMIAKERAARK